MNSKRQQPDQNPHTDEQCEPRLQIVREDERAERKRGKRSQDQGVCQDQRGQEQPADKKRAQKNR